MPANLSKMLFVALASLLLPAVAVFAGENRGMGDKISGADGLTGTPRSFPGYSPSEVASAAQISPARMSRVLSSLEPDRASTRGIAEARIYAAIAPGVVLIATSDGLGSGSVISASGLILTNLHVVGTNTIVAVVFKPEMEGAQVTKANIHTGVVVRRDQVADLALIEVADAPAGVKVISLASMSDVTVGSDVHAIGHPTGEAWTYTKGIVSQIRRDYRWRAEDGIEHTASVIQTQTPINPGNSGGPLLTSRGAIIGVNSFKTAGEGLNFAVSVDDIKTLLNAKADRRVRAEVLSARKEECSAKSYGVSRSKDGSGTEEIFDIDCYGKPDAVLVTPDDKAEPILLKVDPGHVGRVTGVIVSNSRDGKWNASVWDTTGAGKATLQCVHDGSIKPTRCEKYAG